MCRIVTVAMLFLLVGEAAAQDQTPRQGSDGGSYFGAPVLKYTAIRDQGAVMFGGRGGWNLTRSLVLGGGAYGTMTEVDAPAGAVPTAPGPLDIKLETFGIDLEYAIRPAAPTHLTVTAFMGGAAAHYVDDGTKDQEGETDFMLLLEPSVGLERRVTDWMHLNLAVSYRLVRGVEQAGLTADDLNGASGALAVKLGKF